VQVSLRALRQAQDRLREAILARILSCFVAEACPACASAAGTGERSGSEVEGAPRNDSPVSCIFSVARVLSHGPKAIEEIRLILKVNLPAHPTV
jgi:hypothetical protein